MSLNINRKLVYEPKSYGFKLFNFNVALFLKWNYFMLPLCSNILQAFLILIQDYKHA